MEQENAKVEESPTVDDPGTEAPAEDPTAKANELLESLNKLNIDSPERLEGIVQASQQAGHHANLYGQERQKVHELEQRLAQIEQQPRQPQRQYQPQDDYGYYETQAPQAPAISTDDVRKVMREEIGSYIQGQRQATQQAYQQIAQIQKDPNYPAVEKVWNQHINNPNVRLAIESGQTSLRDEFNRVNIAYFKNLAMQSKGAIEGLMKGSQKVASQETPHMEQATTTPSPGISQSPTQKEALQAVAEKSAGTDDDLDAMLAAVLPDDDLFLQLEGEYEQGTRAKG